MADKWHFMTAAQVRLIPESDLPLLVLSDNLRSFFSAAIKRHESGCYNHMMWMHRPGYFLTQGWFLHEEPVGKFLLGGHRLKFWTCSAWTPDQKREMRYVLRDQLDLPWYQRIYDPLQIVGKWVGADWLQIPGKVRICSDHADFLARYDKQWQPRRHLSPPEVNRELQRRDRYRVYGRYAPD